MNRFLDMNLLKLICKRIFLIVFFLMISVLLGWSFLLPAYGSLKAFDFKTSADLGITLSKKNISYFPPYYLNEGHLEAYEEWKNFDPNGVILPTYNRYNPITVCQYAMTLYRFYTRYPNTSVKENFGNQVNWLCSNAKIKEKDVAVWEYDFPVKDQGAIPPWISAMAQGQAISVLVEAYSLTKEQEYLDVAYKALKTFELDIEDGGVKSYWPDGLPFYEEYATDKKYKVLNGFIFALAGVYDLYRLEKNAKAKDVFDRGVESLKKHIREYDALFTSYYSLAKKPTKRNGYNKTHVRQLSWLYYITGEKIFLEYAKLFNAYRAQMNYSVQVSTGTPEKYSTENKLSDGTVFKNYWSSRGRFPAYIKIDLPKKEKISGLNIVCLSEACSPEMWGIHYEDNFGQMKKMDGSEVNIRTNDFLYLKSLKNYTMQIIFQEPICTKELEFIILTDKGNNNVAVVEVVPLFLEEQYFIDYYNKLFRQFSYMDYKFDD